MFFRNLTDILDKLVELHQILLDILYQEAQMPASCGLNNLVQNHRLRDQTSIKIQELESARIDVVKRYSCENNCNESIKMQDLIKLADPEYQSQLESSRGSLLKLADGIRNLARDNAERAILRMNCITEVQKALHKVYKRQSLYNMQGVVNQPKGACLLERAI